MGKLRRKPKWGRHKNLLAAVLYYMRKKTREEYEINRMRADVGSIVIASSEVELTVA